MGNQRIEAMQELARRGKLPADFKPYYDEALKRGLLSGVTKLTGKVEPKESSGLPSLNVEEDGKQVFKSGGVENATAGLNNAIYDTVGGFADRAQNVINWGIAGANFLTGKEDLTTNMLKADPVGGSKWISDQFERIGVNDPDKVIATNLTERLARMGGEGVGMTIAPELMLSALNKVGVVGDKAAEFLGNVFGKSQGFGGLAKNAVAGGAAGVGAEAAMEAAPDKLKPLAAVVGGLAGGASGAAAAETPAMVRAGGRVAADFAAPLTAGGRERLAGQQLREGATNPETAINAVDELPGELVPGSKPTTFQQTGDMGLGAMERGASAKNPEAFMTRRADQNAARTDAIEGIQATGAPEAVASKVRRLIEDIDARTTSEVDAATAAAKKSADDLGPGATPEVAGASMREGLETARAGAKQRERELWNAVDPDGTLALSAERTTNGAKRILAEVPKASKPVEGEEAAIFAAVGKLPEVAPFSELTALQSRIKTEMRAERIANGESPAYRRLTQLNHAVQDDLENAIAAKVNEDRQAVEAGQLTLEQTAEARIKQWEADWRGRQAGADDTAGVVANGGGRAAAVPGARGAARETGNGLGDSAGDPRLSGDGLASDFDASALDRLKSARAATKSRVETFDNGTLAPIRARPGTTSPYDMPASAVAGRIFAPGPKSFDAIKTYRAAVGDGPALKALTEYAIDRLKRAAMREDGTLDPAKVAAWRKAHSDALRAVPELDAKLADAGKASEAVAAAETTRRAALDEAQAGALGKLMGVNDPEDVTRAIGSIFGRKDAVAEMRRLAKAVEGDPAAQEGLRKAIADHMVDKFISNTEAGTSGLGVIKSDQLQTFVAQNKAALKAAGFSDAEISSMEALAADLQRANRSAASLKLPGGSNTTQDVLATKASDSGASIFVKILLASAGAGAGVASVGGFIPGLAAVVGAGIVGALRQRGLKRVDDIVREALLDPALAKQLMVKARPKAAESSGATLGNRINRSALYSGAVATGAALKSQDASGASLGGA